MWLAGGVEFCGSFRNGVRHGWYVSCVFCVCACSWVGGGEEKWARKGSNASHAFNSERL